MRNRRVLVTGASGSVGRRLVRLLAAEGHEVVAVVRPGKPLPSEGRNVRFVEQDLSSRWPGPSTPPFDSVVYLAQSARYREFPDSGPEMVAVGVDSVVRTADLAVRASATQFVFASTGSIYAPSFSPLREDSTIAPVRFYARSKASAELLLGGYRDLLEVKIVRPFFIYGEGQSERMALPGMVRKVVAGQPLYLEAAPGESSRTDGLRFSPIHANDAAACVRRLLDVRGHATLNLAGDEVVSVREVGEMIGDLTQRRPRFETATNTRDGDLVVDNSALHRTVGEFSWTCLRDGLRAVVAEIRKETS